MPSPLAGRRILVVEDEMMVALLLEDMLADLGCLVVGSVVCVEDALAMIDILFLDAAVLDVNLGGQMSYPIADALIAAGVPFIFSTGYAANRLQEGYRTLPMLQKPYHRSELADALAAILALAPPAAATGDLAA
ncbi:CheY-like chemotaxis protein [Caulobacter ginsengisoli]|uniref:CheY-like chemotaxis protein n=1 Tax=Caulobacter ginsengisoli TaxID=400775 RepID=A0ABU0IYX6_9CAUL|nr:response regulator [Caulobacter ginsengisoli]MDQ0466378.1 CheY-like chemotaxis protein [Caulobacter ginsengisoli]